MKAYKIFSNNYDKDTGLGKQTISLITQLNFDIHLKNLYNFLSKIKNRNIFNILYFFLSSIVMIRSNERIISMSAVSPFNSHAVHFSSCHFYALKHVYSYYMFRFFLNPMNIFYVSLEFLHYKNKKSINIFLSNMEQERFLKVYGKTKAKNIVLRPKLIDRFYNHKNSLLKRGNNLLIVSHNFLLKGGKEINQLSEKFQNHKFFIIGNNRGARNSQNIIKLGKQDISSFSLEKFHFFIYPSKLDSHSFALEEAFINGLIPLTSSNVGFSEYLSKYKYIDKYLINNKNDWNQFFEKIIDLEEKEFDILSNELFFARKDWMQRDIKSEYLTNKII